MRANGPSKPVRGVIAAAKKTQTTGAASLGESTNWNKIARPKLVALYAEWSDKPVQLAPFADYYPASKKKPDFEKRTHEIPFTPEEAARIHEEFWKAPPLMDFEGFAAHLRESVPKLAGARDRLNTDRLARLFSAQPDSFPFSFRTRRLAACSHLLVEALSNAPSNLDTAVVLRKLSEILGDFPAAGSFQQASKSSWQRRDDFPFVHDHLPKRKGGFAVEAQGKAVSNDEIQRLPNGKLKMNEGLAKKMAEILLTDTELKYGWGPDQMEAVLDERLGGGFQYWVLRRMREKGGFPDLVPSDEKVQDVLKTRLARRIRAHYDAGLTTPSEIFAKLHKEGYPDWSESRTILSTLRKSPALDAILPRFKDEASQRKTDEAKQLLDAILADGGKHNFTDVARMQGLSDKDAKRVLESIRVRFPGALPSGEGRARATYRAVPYTSQDLELLRDFVAKMSIRPDFDRLLEVLREKHPDFIERHPLPHGDSLRSIISSHLDVEWRTRSQTLYTELFAKIVAQFPPGTPFTKLVEAAQKEDEGAYALLQAQRLAQSWKDEPEKWPAISKFRDPKTGEFPWEKSRVTPTRALAKRVAKEMKDLAGQPLDAVVKSLAEDPAFHQQYPNFSVEHIHILRTEFGIIPYVAEKRSAAYQAKADTERRALAKRLAAIVPKLGEGERPSAALLARRLGVGERDALAAIHAHPEQFPWFKERPLGIVDEYMAERVAAEIRSASVTMSAADIVAKLMSDPEFKTRYPHFNERHLTVLPSRFDFVPPWMETRRILQSKLLVDALLTAPAGRSFTAVRKELEGKYPGRFSANLDKDVLIDRWASEPEKYPFAQALKNGKGEWKLVGRGLASVSGDEEPSALAARLARLEGLITKSPLLERLAATGSEKSLKNHEALFIQRLNPEHGPFFEQLRRLGLPLDQASIIAVPDGSETAVSSALRDRGWDVTELPLDRASLEAAIRDALAEAIDRSRSEGRPILVVDDGDMAARVLAKHPELQAEASRIRIVNQREYDVTVAEAVASDYTLATVQRTGPDAMAKATPDLGPLLAQLESAGMSSIAGKKIGLLGAELGGPWAQALRALGAEVSLLDADANLLGGFSKMGFHIERDVPDERARFFRRQDLVLVASDAHGVRPEDFDVMPMNAIVGNLSRSALSIDLEALELRSGRGPETQPGPHASANIEYTLKDDRRVKVLAGGFPIGISFEDSVEVSRPLLLLGCLAGARLKNFEPAEEEGFVVRQVRALKIRKPRKAGLSAIELRAARH